MQQCPACHNPLNEGAAFCPSCGAKLGSSPQSAEPTRQQLLTWAMLCHLSALAGLIIPFGNLLGPLVVWLVKKDEMPVVNEQGKESLNFQISMTTYILVAGLLAFVLIGIPILFVLGIVDVVYVVIASVEANKGVTYRYPLTFRLIT